MNTLFRLSKPFLFLLSAERAHYISMSIFSFLLKIPIVGGLITKSLVFEHQNLEREIMGLKFKNPIGLAAGFDKDGKFLDAISAMGFGFVEIGTVTPKAQVGNPKQRLFRLKKDRALINRLGFNNDGVDALVKRLHKFNKPEDLIIGGNIGKNKVTPNENAVNDYLYCFEALHDFVDYFVVNVSSPNTPGLRELQNKESLGVILNALIESNKKKKIQRPILLKISPDLEIEALNEVIELVNSLSIAGIVSSNTTIVREPLVMDKKRVESIGPGGLSGAPLFERSNDFLKHVISGLDDQYTVIGVGGIDQPSKSYHKILLGADLVQLYSGMIYYGPGLIRDSAHYIYQKTLQS